MHMHPDRLPVKHHGISRYSSDFTPCRTGASTDNMTCLLFREPLSDPMAFSVKDVYSIY
jgi:hypothetical protein